jgi:hypothetical protein
MRILHAALFAVAGLCSAGTVYGQSAHSPEPGNPPSLTTLPQDTNRLIVPPIIANTPLPDITPLVSPASPPPLTSDFWTSLDFLWWFVEPSTAPVPLISTGPRTSQSTVLGNGVLGSAGTSVVFPTKDIAYGTFSGMRLLAGGWLDGDNTFGLETTFILTERREYGYGAHGDDTTAFFPTIPFTLPGGAATSLLNQQLNTVPGAIIPSSIDIAYLGSHQMFGQDINFVANVGRTACHAADLLAGFRWMQMNESAMLGMTSVNDVDGLFATVSGIDAVAVNNNFFGGQIGGRIREKFGKFTVESTVKIAMGSTRQSININGYRVVQGPPGINNFTQPGFVFTQPTNIGQYVVNRFAVLPEVGAKVGLDLTSWCSLNIGYNFLFLSSVARANDQFDNRTRPNVSYQPVAYTASRPEFLKENNGYWIQGVSAGVEFRY